MRIVGISISSAKDTDKVADGVVLGYGAIAKRDGRRGLVGVSYINGKHLFGKSVAAIGAAGLAIGLALQGSLANFAGGVLIMLFRPFRAGDWIEAQGVSGSVDSIQIFHTTLKTADNKVVIVPNGSLSNGHITNYSRESTRRADINLGIDYSSDIRLAREVLLKIAEDPRVLRDPEPVVFVTGLGDSAVNLSLRVWVATPDFWPVTFGFTELAKERLLEIAVVITGPQLSPRVEGPVIVVYPEGTWYTYMDEKVLDEIIEEHLRHGRPVERDAEGHSAAERVTNDDRLLVRRELIQQVLRERTGAV